MKKSVLISIQPKWVDMIISSKKTIEVRKTRPKLETPFKCYIYCTKEPLRKEHIVWGNEYRKPSKEVLCRIPKKHSKDKDEFCFIELPIRNELYKENVFNGKVIGEFVCDSIDEYWYDCCVGVDIDDDELVKTMLDEEEINIYAKGKDLYGWHISDLVVYSKPKELSEFNTIKKCKSCMCGYESSACIFDGNCKVPIPITRPPQDWCYVEEL